MKKLKIKLASTDDVPVVASVFLDNEKLVDCMAINEKIPNFKIFEFEKDLSGSHVLKIEYHNDDDRGAGDDHNLVLGECALSDALGNYPPFDYLIFDGGAKNLIWRPGVFASRVIYNSGIVELSFDADDPEIWHDYNGETEYITARAEEMLALALAQDAESTPP